MRPVSALRDGDCVRIDGGIDEITHVFAESDAVVHICFTDGVVRRAWTDFVEIAEWDTVPTPIVRQSQPQRREPRSQIPIRIRERIFKRDGYICRKCGSKLFLTIDHIHPMLHGGLHNEENLQVLCRSCNSKKGAKVQ